MSPDLTTIDDLRKATGLSQIIESAFRGESAAGTRALHSMSYQFRPAFSETAWNELIFDIVLNAARYDHVSSEVFDLKPTSGCP
jgi:hypothetical protein